MSKKRVGINLDHKVWELSKELAHDKRESLSGYIEGLITGRLGENEKGSTNQIKEASQLDRIESKLDQFIANYDHKDLVVEKTANEMIEQQDLNAEIKKNKDAELSVEANANEVLPEDEIIAKAQAKLEAVRAEKKRSEIKGAIKTVDEIPEKFTVPLPRAQSYLQVPFNPQPKLKDKAKK